MGMKRVLVPYFVTLVVFVAIDPVWPSVMANRLYQPVMADMLFSAFRLAAAVAFYLFYSVGLTFLAKHQTDSPQSQERALRRPRCWG